MALAATAVCAGARAQPPPAPAAKAASTSVAGVTVEGRKAIDIKKRFPSVVEKFVQSHEVDGPHGGLTRWMRPICPAVEGLTPEFNAFVYRRLLEVTAVVGAPRSRPGACPTPNVMVVFTTAADQVMADVRANHELLLGYHYPSDTKKLATFEPPLKSWRVTASNGQIDDPESIPVGSSTGRIRSGIVSEFVYVLVLVDPSLLEGQPIGRVADNIAEHALSSPGSRKGCAALPSILDALDMTCPASDTVEGLTDYDIALLKGLYRSEADTQGNFQRGAVLRQILRDTKPPALAGN